jgi:hypothetical protein
MSNLFRTIFKISKPIHKYVGLVCLVYFILMGVTGVLLNHPSLIRPFSIPLSWMPGSYNYVKWNRMALREAVFSTAHPGTVYIGGKSGVWRSRDNGNAFTHLTRGFPTSAYDRDTRSLLLRETGHFQYLYAGTQAGLYRYNVLDANSLFLIPFLYNNGVKCGTRIKLGSEFIGMARPALLLWRSQC